MPNTHIDANLSFINLFLQADAIVKLVIVALLVMSVIGWSIIFNQGFVLRSLNRKISNFLRKLHSRESLIKLYDYAVDSKDSVIGELFAYAIEEVKNAKNSNQEIDYEFKAHLVAAMQARMNLRLLDCEKNLTFLATIASSGPFIGLFGTVWGIMTSFQSIALSKNTSLAVVAPGIAEALFATALGLIAAIPAVIFYNRYSGQIYKMGMKIDSYISEIVQIIFREVRK